MGQDPDDYENRAMIDMNVVGKLVAEDFAKKNPHLFKDGKQSLSSSLQVQMKDGKPIFRLFYTVS